MVGKAIAPILLSIVSALLLYFFLHQVPLLPSVHLLMVICPSFSLRERERERGREKEGGVVGDGKG